ncbi:MAG: formate--phosphoribosylaminoimidazolecarboxamide ligase [Dehalococcoidia bacterium]|nr:formate--phosphoribosylaminoimidazolecarboxamide ligase [Dehalococcoidia bacterium]
MSNDIEATVQKSIQKLMKLDEKDITIATLCSHSSLQIFNAAKREGFRTLGILKREESNLKDSYDVFPLARPCDYFEVEEYPQMIQRYHELLAANIIFIPTGSAVEYLRVPGSPHHGLELLSVPIYGNRRIVQYEFNREKQREWLEKEAGLLMPEELEHPKQIDGAVIIKLQGAPGGRGSVVVTSYAEYKRFIDFHKGREDYTGAIIQRFISGTRYYLQFFATPFGIYNGSDLEFWGADRRDESNADEFFKVGTRAQLLEEGNSPTYNVTGNTQVVLRESILLNQAIPAGRKTLEASKRLVPGGIVGPFCLETVVDPGFRMYVFEISARIVAGSNALVPSSAYAMYTYSEEMTYARRIMIDIKEGLKRGELQKVVT